MSCHPTTIRMSDTVDANKMSNNNNVAYMFNKFFLDLLRTAKYISPCYATTVKTQYHSIDKQSTAYIDRFLECNAATLEAITEENVSVKILKLKVLHEFSLGEIVVCSDIVLFRRNILDKLGADFADGLCRLVKEDTALILRKSICMAIMARLSSTPELFGDAVTEIVRGEQGLPPSDNAKDAVVRALVIELASICSSSSSEHEEQDEQEEVIKGAPPPPSMDDLLENSTLGKLAKEIAADIDMSKLQNCNDPSELFSNASLMKDVYGKVANMLNTQISEGGVDQKDLLGECMNLVRTFGAPPKAPSRKRK